MLILLSIGSKVEAKVRIIKLLSTSSLLNLFHVLSFHMLRRS